MRFSLALIAAVAAATSVAAQDIASIISQIPSCALTCIATASAGQSCAITDYKCQCSKMSAIQASATGCVTSKCTTDEAISTSFFIYLHFSNSNSTPQPNLYLLAYLTSKPTLNPTTHHKPSPFF